MRQLIGTLFLLFLDGRQIDPYTHTPTWTDTDWYDAGIQGATSSCIVKGNEAPADNHSDRNIDCTEYLKGYTERQYETCRQDFVCAKNLTGKTFPPSCDTVENTDQLHSA